MSRGAISRPQAPSGGPSCLLPPSDSAIFFLKVPRWGTAGAYRRRPRRATDGRPSKCPAAWGGRGSVRRALVCPWWRGGKRKKSHRRFQFILHGEKLLRPLSAVRLVNNERPEALLCESSASNNRARRAGRSQQIDRAIFPACGALNWLACGAFRSACCAERTRPKSQACGGSLLTCLLTRRGSGLRANGSKQIHLLLYSSTVRSSFVPASCWL